MGILKAAEIQPPPLSARKISHTNSLVNIHSDMGASTICARVEYDSRLGFRLIRSVSNIMYIYYICSLLAE